MASPEKQMYVFQDWPYYRRGLSYDFTSKNLVS